MNKKGMNAGLFLIIFFTFLAIGFIFYSVLVFNIGSDYVVDDIVDVAENISGVPASSVAQAQQLEQDYNALAIPYDLFFLALWIGAFVTTLTSTIQSNKTGVFSFFGFLFVGSLILLLLTAYVSDFASWFMANVFDTLFATSAISTPILDYYLNNLGFLNFIWWLILVLVAFIDRGIISKSGSVEE